jgi:hypothetical protein
MIKRLIFSVLAVGCTAKSDDPYFDLEGKVDLAPAPFEAGVPRSWDIAVTVPPEAVFETDQPAGGAWLDMSADAEGTAIVDLTDVDVPDHSSHSEEEIGPKLGTSIGFGPEMSSCTPGEQCLRSFVLTLQTDVATTFTELVFSLSVIDGSRTPEDAEGLRIEVEATEQTN